MRDLRGVALARSAGHEIRECACRLRILVDRLSFESDTQPVQDRAILTAIADAALDDYQSLDSIYAAEELKGGLGHYAAIDRLLIASMSDLLAIYALATGVLDSTNRLHAVHYGDVASTIDGILRAFEGRLDDVPDAGLAQKSAMKWMRATTEPSFLDYVDLLSRGSTEEWQDLYAEAKQNLRVRALVEKALPLADPDIGAAKELWRYLLDSMQTVEPAEPLEATDSPVRQRLREIADRTKI